MKRWLTAGAITVALGFGLLEPISANLSAEGVNGSSPQVQGRAKIVDGDSLEVGNYRIRLSGIDAPEGRQRCRDASGQPYSCGRQATTALRDMIQGQSVRCERLDVDRYKRWVSDCFAGETWLNEAMVQSGWAVAYVRYDDRFKADERQARQNKQGIWQGRFTRPSKWRAQQR